MEASVALNNPEILTIEKKSSDIMAQAGALAVMNHEQEQAGIEFIKGIKVLKKEIEVTFGPIKKKTHEAWKESVAQEKKHLDPLDAAEKMVRGKVIGYQDEQERLRRAEEARLQEIARKEQQKRIDAATKKVNSLLEKSGDVNEQIKTFEAERQVEGLTDEDIAAIDHRLNMLRVKRDNIERAVLDKQAEVEQAQYVAPVPTVAPAAPKPQGASSRVKKKAQVTNPMVLIKTVAAGTVPIGVITFDMSALDKLINAGAIIPGVSFTEDRKLTVR